MTTVVLETCRAILKQVEPEQEFLLDENFAQYAAGYPEPAFVPEGRFEGTAMTLFVAILVPFVVEVFKEGTKDALKDKVKDGLDRLFRRRETARQEDIASLRTDVEKIIAKTQLSARERERLRNKIYKGLDALAQRPLRSS